MHPDDQQYCLDVFSDAFELHKPFEMKYRLKRRDGEYRHFIDHGEPYIDNDGKFSGFIGSSTDVSEQKKSEIELQKSHKELTQYNHEISLINQLNSYLQVCRSMDETYPVVSYYAEKIFPACSGALYLFNENKSLVEAVTSWGNKAIKSSTIISPDDCWSLRQGKEHSTIENDIRLSCKHIDAEKGKGYACEPIIAQGERACN